MTCFWCKICILNDCTSVKVGSYLRLTFGKSSYFRLTLVLGKKNWRVPISGQHQVCMYVCVYIYICCRAKAWSKNYLFWRQNLVQVRYFPFLFFQNEENEIFKKGKRRLKSPFLSQNLVHLCCTTCLDQVLTQPWTKFWLNIFGIFGRFLHCFKPTPKNRNTIYEHNYANWLFCLFVLHFAVCVIQTPSAGHAFCSSSFEFCKLTLHNWCLRFKCTLKIDFRLVAFNFWSSFGIWFLKFEFRHLICQVLHCENNLLISIF